MTREEMEKRKEELKIEHTVPEILNQYGVQVKRGRCKAVCHEGKNYTVKVSDELYYCFKCDQSMDIFDITMHFNHCDFWTAFELLGGTEKPSFTTVVKANQAKIEREQKIALERKKKAESKQIRDHITAYRNIIASETPFSDLWSYCQNKLQYQSYLLELQTEKR